MEELPLHSMQAYREETNFFHANLNAQAFPFKWTCCSAHYNEYSLIGRSTNLEMIFRDGDATTRASSFTGKHTLPIAAPTDRVIVPSINTVPAVSTHSEMV